MFETVKENTYISISLYYSLLILLFFFIDFEIGDVSLGKLPDFVAYFGIYKPTS